LVFSKYWFWYGVSGAGCFLLIKRLQLKSKTDEEAALLPEIEDVSETTAKAVAQIQFRERVAFATGIFILIFSFFSSSLLPTMFEMMVPSAIKSYAQSRMRYQWNSSSSSGWRWVWTWYLALGEPAFKYWPDLLVFYGLIFLTALISFLSTSLPISLGRRLSRRIRVPGYTFTLGQVGFLFIWLFGFVSLLVYWGRRKYWDTTNRSAIPKAELWARIIGQLANACLGLVLLAVPRNVGLFPGIPWESVLIPFHYASARIFIVLITIHAFLWFRAGIHHGFMAKYPIGFKYPYLWYDNWTIALAILVFICVLIAMGFLAFIRRSHWEIFKWSHHVASLALVVTVIWHASMAWYYFLPGIILYLCDRILRYLKGVNASGSLEKNLVQANVIDDNLIVLKYPAEWARKPGQYAWIHISEVSLYEWHPFSISSGPGSIASHHIKVQGHASWTWNLRQVIRQNKDLTLSVDAPYGTPPNFNAFDKICFVAGGIGITPIASVLLSQSRLVVPTKLIWIAKSRTLFRNLNLPLAKMITASVAQFESKFDLALFETCPEKKEEDISISDGENDDPIFGLPINTGRPDIAAQISNFCVTPQLVMTSNEKTKETSSSRVEDYSGVLVFAVGPPALVASARKISDELGLTFHAEAFEL